MCKQFLKKSLGRFAKDLKEKWCLDMSIHYVFHNISEGRKDVQGLPKDTHP